MFKADFEIIDFHTHPFINGESNICNHKEFCNMGVSQTLEKMDGLNVGKICGSVIRLSETKSKQDVLERMLKNNDEALTLKDMFDGRYVVGYHVHPEFVEQSIKEIDRMNALDVKLIGELVPYIDGWKSYIEKGFYEILDYAQKFDVVVSFHSSDYDDNEIDKLVKDFSQIRFVGAHPGEISSLLRHIERMKNNDNYFIDVSGTGLFREGMTRRVIDEVGADKILFGSDFPTCNMAMFVGGIALDNQLTESEKEKILSLNAKRLLGIK